MMKQRWGLDRNVLRLTPGDPWGVEQQHWNTGAEENQQLNPSGRVKRKGWGYTHDCCADKNPYPHDCRADKDSYPHDRNVTDDLCSLIKLCFAFIMVNFST